MKTYRRDRAELCAEFDIAYRFIVAAMGAPGSHIRRRQPSAKTAPKTDGATNCADANLQGADVPGVPGSTSPRRLPKSRARHPRVSISLRRQVVGLCRGVGIPRVEEQPCRQPSKAARVVGRPCKVRSQTAMKRSWATTVAGRNTRARWAPALIVMVLGRSSQCGLRHISFFDHLCSTQRLGPGGTKYDRTEPAPVKWEEEEEWADLEWW